MKGLIVVAVSIGIMLLAGCATPQASNYDLAMKGKQAEDFTLTALDGSNEKLSGHRGKPVVLAFWAVGCPPCRAEAPHLSQLVDQYGSRGLTVLAVNAWDESKEMVSRFATDNKLKQRILLNGSEVSRRYRVEAVPTVLWIDPAGMITGTLVGDDSKALKDSTERLMAGGK